MAETKARNINKSFSPTGGIEHSSIQNDAGAPALPAGKVLDSKPNRTKTVYISPRLASESRGGWQAFKSLLIFLMVDAWVSSHKTCR